MRKTLVQSRTKLDARIREALVDCDGESEQATGLFTSHQRALLRKIPGLKLVELQDSEL